MPATEYPPVETPNPQASLVGTPQGTTPGGYPALGGTSPRHLQEIPTEVPLAGGTTVGSPLGDAWV